MVAARKLVLPSRDREYLRCRILAVSGRIFSATSISPNVDTPLGSIFERPNFCPKHAARKERYRAATVREPVHLEKESRIFLFQQIPNFLQILPLGSDVADGQPKHEPAVQHGVREK